MMATRVTGREGDMIVGRELEFRTRETAERADETTCRGEILLV
jgi:hypothetical protein